MSKDCTLDVSRSKLSELEANLAEIKSGQGSSGLISQP